MPVSVKLYEAVFTERTVTLPDECPVCGADLHAEGAINEWNWNDANVASHITDEPDVPIEGEGYTECGDTYYPHEIWCNKCDTAIANSTGVVPPEEAQRIRDERARLAGMTHEQILAEIIG